MFNDEFANCKEWQNSILHSSAIAKLSGKELFVAESASGVPLFILNNTPDIFPPLGVLNFTEYSSKDEVFAFENKYREYIEEKYINFGMAQSPCLTNWQDGVSTVKFFYDNI